MSIGVMIVSRVFFLDSFSTLLDGSVFASGGYTILQDTSSRVGEAGGVTKKPTGFGESFTVSKKPGANGAGFVTLSLTPLAIVLCVVQVYV